MSYSTIKKKLCKCSPDCDKVPTMSCYGYFYGHLPEDLKEKAGTRAKVAVKNRNKRVALGKKLHFAQKEVNSEEQDYAARLMLWFKYHMQTSKKVCDNCGVSLKHYNENDWFGSQHHIVEKGLCRSVASHPQNHLVLGKWCCHSQWHTNWLNSSKMPVFGEAKRKYQLFKDDIALNELKKVNPYLI